MGIAKKVAITAALLALPAAAPGQGGACGRNGMRVPDLGFSTISCEHCDIDMTPGHVSYQFKTEPRVGGINPRGEGRLREGDVLVAVDGAPIPPEAASDRLTTPPRG